ncbi:DUF433 domain-containing protein, partial [Spirulina sp. 06S082]
DRAVRLFASQSVSGIQKTPGVCGGDACIGKTRIPVWSLVNDRRQGMSEAQILAAFPSLSAIDLVNAWTYAEANSEEIAMAIRENEEIVKQSSDRQSFLQLSLVERRHILAKQADKIEPHYQEDSQWREWTNLDCDRFYEYDSSTETR